MKIDDSQKSQFIVLCVLIALVLGFGVYRIVGVSTSAAPVSKTKQAPNTDNKTQETAPSSDTDTTGQSAPEAKEETPNLDRQARSPRDPFASQIDALSHSDQSKMAKNEAKVREHTGRAAAASRQIQPLIPNFIPPLNSVRVSPLPGNARVVASEVDPTKDLKLTGIVEGQSRLAIVRGPGKARYIVQEGQVIDGKYTVELIYSKGILLKFNGKKFVLRLGGNESSEKGTRV